MLNSLILAAGGGHVVNELPIPALWFGIITFIVFMLLLLVTLGFKSVGVRPAEPTSAVEHHGSHHGGH